MNDGNTCVCSSKSLSGSASSFCFGTASCLNCLFLRSFLRICGYCKGNLSIMRQSNDRLKKIPGVQAFINKKSSKFNVVRHAGAECSICLESYQDSKTKEIAELNCSNKHMFHKDCLVKWAEKNDICPLCREPIQKDKKK